MTPLTHRPNARSPRRADDVRAQARRLGLPARARPRAARRARSRGMRVGKLSGAVGTYATTTPTSSGSRARRSGSSRPRRSTQILQRDRHAELLATLAMLASSLDRFALEIRHLARTEVREVEEPFGRGQKGSSAMPHKRNPIVVGADLRPRARRPRRTRSSASRTSRSGTSATSRTRPPSGSCCRTRSSRSTTCSTASPGSSRGSSCGPSGCARTSKRPAASSSASACCSRSSSPGSIRDDAYRLVQRHAMRAWDEGLDFRSLVRGRPRDRGSRRSRRGVRPRRVHAARRRVFERRPRALVPRGGCRSERLGHAPRERQGARDLRARRRDARCSSRATGSRRSTSSCRRRSRTRAGCSPASRRSGSPARARSCRTTCSSLRDDGRSMVCRRLEMLPVEFVVRGYLAGLGLEGLPRDGRRLRARAAGGPARSRRAFRSRSSRRRRRPPRGTTRTSTRSGPQRSAARSATHAARRRARALPLRRRRTPRRAESSSPTRSSSSASRRTARSSLGDEALTPDSSRFWPGRRTTRPDGRSRSFDKQFVRDWCERPAGTRNAPGPGAARRCRRRHARALRRGVRAAHRRSRSPTTSRDPRRCCEGDRARSAQGRDPRPAGRGRRQLVAEARLRRRAALASDASSISSSRPTTPTEARAQIERMCAELLANPLIESVRDQSSRR